MMSRSGRPIGSSLGVVDRPVLYLLATADGLCGPDGFGYKRWSGAPGALGQWCGLEGANLSAVGANHVGHGW